MKFKQTNLPNGGKLYYVRNRINESSAIDINFDCGSRFDSVPGLAHFTEHMFFTGTKELTKEDIAKKYPITPNNRDTYRLDVAIMLVQKL